MAIPKKSVTYFNFTGGLNTEATPVSREPNDAVDIENIDINIDGSIAPRRGMDFIGSKSDTTFYETSAFDYTSVQGVYADEVPGVAVFKPIPTTGVPFTVVIAHVGTEFLIFDYDKINDLTLIDAPRQTIDMSVIGEDAQVHHKTMFAPDKNRLYCVNKHLPFGYIEYDADTNLFAYQPENILTRDLSGDAAIDSRVNHGGKNYQAIRNHQASVDTEPGVGDVWEDNWVQLGPTLEGDASWSLGGAVNKVRVDAGGWRAFSATQTHVSTFDDIPGGVGDWEDFWVEVPFDISYPVWLNDTQYSSSSEFDYTSNVDKLDNLGQTSAIFSAGRLWVSGTTNGTNKIFFSQIINKDVQYSRMFQEADPFSEIDSDTVDTDGGDISIVGAEQILSLAALQGGVIVFATNGIWYVRGTSGVFRATDFSIDKVSSDGIAGANCWANINDRLVYFGQSNIYAITAQDADILPTTQVISDKISTFYSSIPLSAKQAGKAVYNGSTRKLYFFTNFFLNDWTVERNPNTQPTHLRDVLILDTRLGAWYKHTLSEDTVGSKVAIGDVFNIDGGSQVFASVVDNSNNLVEDDVGNLVEAFDTSFNDSEQLTSLFLIKKNGDNTDWAFGQLVGDALDDFSLNATDTESVDGFVETAHQVFNDITHKKQTPYITTIFKRVESGIIDEETGEDITPGGCLMTTHYDFSTSSKSAKFGTARQAYKPTRWSVSYFDGSDPGTEVVKNKHKIRGRGDAYQLRFENDPGKDFKLYGFQVDVTTSRKV